MKKPAASLLADIEAQHGFVFGTPDDHASEHAAPAATLSCSNPKCKNRGMPIVIHEDTIRPVHCGGLTRDDVACHAVLLEAEQASEDVSRVILDTVSPEILDQLIEQMEARKARR